MRIRLDNKCGKLSEKSACYLVYIHSVIMGSKRAQMEKKINELTKKTKLSKQVVHSLVEHWQALSKDKGLDRDTMRGDLMNEFNMLDDFLLDRIFRTFDRSANGQHLKLDDYVQGMAIFLTGNLEDKIEFCFKVYDLNGDGYITREEMFQLLKSSIVQKSHEEDEEEGTKDLTEMILKKLDHDDHDGRVSPKDFYCAVMGDKLLLESLGQCLPTEECKIKYLKMLGEQGKGNRPASGLKIKSQNSKAGKIDQWKN